MSTVIGAPLVRQSPYARRYTQDEKAAILGRYNAGEPMTRLAVAFATSTSGIARELRRVGAVIRSHGGRPRTYALDETVFDTITEESAYWIGFLMGDGCVSFRSDTNAYVILVAAEKDAEHIEKFRAFLKTDCPISKRKYGRTTSLDCPSVMHQISVSSLRMALTLGRYGVRPRKSLTARVCSMLSLNRNFWRGLIDADGGFTLPSDPAGSPILFLTGSKYIVQQFSHAAKWIDPDARLTVAPKENIAYIRASGLHAGKLAYWLYAGSTVALARKTEIAQRLIERYWKKIENVTVRDSRL